MAEPQVTWAIAARHIESRGDALSSIDLMLTYPSRECELHIVLSPPAKGETPENKIVMQEFDLLRQALDRILSERKS